MNLKYRYNQKYLDYGLNIILPNDQIFLNEAFLLVKNNNLFLILGAKNSDNNDLLSSGSLIESTNAQPIPKISFGVGDFHQIKIFNKSFFIKGQIAHGWLDSGQYLKAPFLHEKSFYIKKILIKDYSFSFGLVHEALWGGETEIHGKQPSGTSDLIRVFFARPGSKKSIYQEKKNALGNHLGIWDLSIEKEFNNKLIKIYLEHPFEDESSARWILNEFDGLYGININQKKSSYISEFTYEYINTMDQSGSQGASDSTYGWDNYYNHYIYQSGWTNNGRVIGNPLFTRGSNKGRYSDSQYIINNRLTAHHFGFLGSISEKINYKILFTYSKNFGTYPDEDYFKSNNKVYRFENGLIQRSGLIELSAKNLFDKVNVSLVYGFDNGELLNKTDSFMLKINHKFVF
ncbi:MAG: capsule assembly Wzi family protein [Candidatus Neomarinimicrobiota bacterium]